MYVRISLYKAFLFGLMDIRIYVSTTVVRMDQFMYGCMLNYTTACLIGWIYGRMYACLWLNSWSVDVKMDFY